jgi:hypothetical protein
VNAPAQQHSEVALRSQLCNQLCTQLPAVQLSAQTYKQTALLLTAPLACILQVAKSCNIIIEVLNFERALLSGAVWTTRFFYENVAALPKRHFGEKAHGWIRREGRKLRIKKICMIKKSNKLHSLAARFKISYKNPLMFHKNL